MIQGLLRVIDKEQMDRLHAGALADAGCKVDFHARRAWFRPEVVERQIAAQRGRYRMVRSSLWYPFCRELPEDGVAAPAEFTVDYGFATPWIFDYPRRAYRTPTAQDQIDMIRLGDALEPVAAVNAPLICSEFDPRIENVESSRLLLMHTRKPGWVGTSSAGQVPYLAEMAALAAEDDSERLRTAPPIIVTAYCTTSPLKLDARSCDVLERAIKYGFPVNFAPMPILGATSPMTPAGSVVVAAAEILGCMTATTLINSDLYYYSTSIAAEMDMRTTQICFATPAAMLTDAALHQLFRFRYGMVHNVEPAYVEAKAPGIEAAMMKAYRQMALGSTASLPLAIGALDSAAVFSPTQAMLDLDFNEAIFKFFRGMQVDDESLGLDLIAEMEFCAKDTYLAAEHTAEHFRQVGWNPRLLQRTYCDHNAAAEMGDEKLLERADKAWREVLAGHRPMERDSRFLTELDRIIQAARKELLQ